MAEPMTLRDEDVGRIGEYVKPWLRELVDEVVPRPEPASTDTRLLERMIKVEEEIKAQRTLMDERFGLMERRFEAVDKRFEELIGRTDTRFEELIGQMNARFETVDKRFETVDKRFEESNANANSRFKTLALMIGVGFGVLTSLTTLFALLL